jgi:hypothetical protein
MMKKLGLRILGTSLFGLSVATLSLTLVSVVSAEEDFAPCPPCHSVMLTCDGSTCTCSWTDNGYKCFPPAD